MASYLAKRLVLFKNRSFVFTCIMDFFSAMAVGMTYISLSWHLLTIYNSVNAIIIFMLTWWVAGTVLSPLTGYFADRYPRRMIVLTANALRVVIIFIYLFISFDNLISIYLFTSLWGLILAFFMPAMLIFARELFQDYRHLMYVNSTIDGIFEIGMVIGMSLGGLLISFITMHSILYFLLLFTMIAFLASSKIYPARIAEKTHDGFIKNWQSIYRYLQHKRFVVYYYFAQIIFTCLFMVVPAFLAPYAKNVLHATAFEFGIIETSFSIGFIIGTIIIPWFVDKHSSVTVLSWVVTFSAILYLNLSLLHNVYFAIVCYFFVGSCISSWAVIVTLAQKHTPLHLQGKAQGLAYGASGLLVMGIYSLFFIFNKIHPLPSNQWFYFMIVLALLILIPLHIGKKKQRQHGDIQNK